MRARLKDIFISSCNVITPLGMTTEENFNSMLQGQSGIDLHNDIKLSPIPFYASLFSREQFDSIPGSDQLSRFEKLSIASVRSSLSESKVKPEDKRSLFILSTTKGNIDLLENDPGSGNLRPDLYLWNSADKICKHFGFVNKPVVVSDACISGVQAILTANRLIRAGLYDHVVVNGTDIISEFILSGFNSFKSLSNGPCRPFDKLRDGLSLGEGSGTIILTTETPKSDNERIIAGYGFSSNDANHISGPSRTGEGLFQAIEKVRKMHSGKIDYISAHGTATPYNDEMESVALSRTGLNNVPVNGFKGFFGHTLGAAGVIESILAVESLRRGMLIRTLGYTEPGTTNPLNVIDSNRSAEISNCLKIASGFGGCNAAIYFEKR